MKNIRKKPWKLFQKLFIYKGKFVILMSHQRLKINLSQIIIKSYRKDFKFSLINFVWEKWNYHYTVLKNTMNLELVLDFESLLN